jgi:predicted TIM-barrel fold metal-dependent hydrolase
LQKFPKLIILGHGPVFWAEIGRLEVGPSLSGRVKRRSSMPIREEGVLPKLFRKYPNLYGDLSDQNPWYVLARDPEYGQKFLTEFQDRLLFGTDICSFETPFHIMDLLIEWRDMGKISEEVFNKVTRDNAVKLLDLE